MKTVRFDRRLNDGSLYLLGVAIEHPEGWRFIPNVASHESSRKFHATMERCVPRWVGYLDYCETELARNRDGV